MPIVTEPWFCPNCASNVATPFGAQCGERPIQAFDLTLRGVAARVLHALTGVDDHVMRAFRRLLRHPGTLTKAYVDGQRKPLGAPFSLFLMIANVLFFAVQSLTGINVLGASPRRLARRSGPRLERGGHGCLRVQLHRQLHLRLPGPGSRLR